MKKERNYSVELLRIIAMLLIILHHFAVHGSFDFVSGSHDQTIWNVLILGGKIGVDIFILIMGYYSTSTRVSREKVIRLGAQVLFYSVACFFLLLALRKVELNGESLGRTLLPLLDTDGYWFIITYLLLYCMTPLLNRGIGQLQKKYHAGIIGLLLVLWVLLPGTLKQIRELSIFGFSELTFFILLYLLGAYLRKYSCPLYGRKTLTMLLLLGFGLLEIGACVGRDLLRDLGPEGVRDALTPVLGYLCSPNMNAPLTVILAVLFLICFQNFTLKPNRVLGEVAAATFGVYLIHDNYFVSRVIWKDIFHTEAHSRLPSMQFVLYAFAVMALVFVVCTVIEILRKKLLEKPFMKWVEKMTEKLFTKVG